MINFSANNIAAFNRLINRVDVAVYPHAIDHFLSRLTAANALVISEMPQSKYLNPRLVSLSIDCLMKRMNGLINRGRI